MPDLRSVSCVLYRRVSTEKQAGEVYSSLEDQDLAGRQLAEKLRATIGHVYTDDGYSGATIEQRPGMQQLLTDCAAAPKSLRSPGYVLVLNDSRWGRFPDPEESTYWRVHLSKLGWTVRFAENDDTDNKPIRALMRAMVAGQATQKREDVKANAKRGMRGTVDRGYWCSQEPFGYRRKVVYPPGRERVLATGVRKATDEKVVLVPEASEAAIVRVMFERYASGEHSISSLVGWLKDDAPQLNWRDAAVRYALNNPAYVGDIVFGRVPADRYERRVNPTRDAADWYVTRDAHPAVIDRAMFERVQELLGRNRRTKRGVRSDWTLSGIVECRCGKPFVSGGGGRKRDHRAPSYRCTTQGNSRAYRCGYPGTIVKTALEHAVIDAIAREASSKYARRRILDQLDASIEASRAAPDGRLASLRAERASVVQRRERLLAAIEEGTAQKNDVRDRLEQLRATDQRLSVQVAVLEGDAPMEERLRAERERVAALLNDLPTLFRRLSGPALRELVRPWVERAVFNTESRELRLEIRHFPRWNMLSGSTPPHPAHKHGRDGVTVRRIVVSGRAA